MKKFLFSLFFSLAYFVIFPNIIWAVDAPINCSGVNMSRYIGCQAGTECEPVTSTAKGDSYAHECRVTNKVEWLDNSNFKQYSNEIHFLYQLTGSGVSFLQDTIWGGMSCDGGGDAIYRVYKDGGTWGAEQFGINMGCGSTFNKPASYLKTYNKSKMLSDGFDIDGADFNKNIDAYNCNVSGQSGITTGGSTQLIFDGQAKCCDTTFDTAVIMNTDGPGAGEVYVYCADRGLCAHYQSLNFADKKNNPENWNSDTDLCRLTAGADKDEYYLYPISGINNQDGASFYSDLVNQGYQSYCYVPTEELQGDLAMDETWTNHAASLQVESEQKFDYSKAEVPLWRKFKEIGFIGIDGLFDSLEAYWGSRNAKEEDPFLKDISSAPIYSLISKKDQCLQKRKLLQATNELCNKLENPASCALDRIIPAVTRNNQGYRAQNIDNTGTSQEDSGYTFLKLMNDLNANGLSCGQIALRDFTSAKQEELAQALDNVPFYLDKAYRLGFLVVAAEIQDNAEENPAFNFLPFNFFGNNSNRVGSSGSHDVRVVAFKIPDISTNRDPNSPGYYQDALELTANSLLEKSYIDEYQQQITAEKAMGTLPGSTPLIKALETQYYSQSELVKALVNFVNSRTNQTAFYGPTTYNPSDAELLCGFNRNHSPKIQDLPLDEPASGNSYSITDKTGLYQDREDKLSDKFRNTLDGGGNMMENLEEEHIFQEYPPDNMPLVEEISEDEDFIDQELAIEEVSSDSPWAFKFLSNFSLLKDKKEDSAKDPKIFTYIIIPQGYQLAAAEEALSGLIYTHEEKERMMADLNEAPPFLKLQNTGLQFFSDPAKSGATKPSEPGCLDNLATPDINECTQAEIIAEVKLKDESKINELEPRILGGRLGYITRKIQESLHRANSQMHNWLTSLNSTEEYLLGLGDPSKAEDHKSAICAYDGGYKIESKSLRSLIAKAAKESSTSIEMMSILIGGENCKHAGEATNICTKSDSFYSTNNLLDKGKTYLYQETGDQLYFNGCPNKIGNYVGPFRLNAFLYPSAWNDVAINGNNPCSIHDNIYALGNLVSGYGIKTNSNSEEIKKAMVKWVLGAPTWEGGPVSCQSAMDVADKYEGGGDTEICEIKTAAGGCVQKEWLWAVGAYCCAVDHVFGDDPGSYCTTDTWVNDVTPVRAEACQ